jgi:hypothetical protein
LAGSQIFSVRSILAGSVLRTHCTSEFNRHRQTDTFKVYRVVDKLDRGYAIVGFIVQFQ